MKIIVFKIGDLICIDKTNDTNKASLYYKEYSIVDNVPLDVYPEDFDGFEFNLKKYNARVEKENEAIKIKNYEDNIVAEIRKKYNLNQELAILRQRDTKIQEYNEYYEYVESCKAKVKSEIGG